MFTLKIETDNDAFSNEPVEVIADMLEGLAALLRVTSERSDSGPMIDPNGNIVGRWELELDEKSPF